MSTSDALRRCDFFTPRAGKVNRSGAAVSVAKQRTHSTTRR
jgi:hypothetical protein